MVSTLNTHGFSKEWVRQIYSSLWSIGFRLKHHISIEPLVNPKIIGTGYGLLLEEFDRQGTLKLVRMLIPTHHYRNTITYESYIFLPNSKMKRGSIYLAEVKRLAQSYHGNEFKRIYRINSDFSGRDFYYSSINTGLTTHPPHVTEYSQNITDEMGNKMARRLRYRLSGLIKKSGLIGKAREMLIRQVTNGEYSTAIELCEWLLKFEKTSELDHLILNYANTLKSFRVHYGNTYTSITKRILWRVREGENENQVLREFTLSAFAEFKATFKKSAYGALIAKMSIE